METFTCEKCQEDVDTMFVGCAFQSGYLCMPCMEMWVCECGYDTQGMDEDGSCPRCGKALSDW